MSQAATETQKFYADVSTDDEDLGRCFCELTVNPYIPRKMAAVLHFDEVPTVSIWGKKLTVVANGVEVITDGHSGSNLPLNHEATRVRSGVERVTWTIWFEDEPLVSLVAAYRFPLTALTSRSPGIGMKHGSVGSIRGDVKEVGDILHVVPPKLTALSLDGVEVNIGSVLDFYSSGRSRYPEEHVVRESLLVVKVNADGDLSHTLERARGVAEAILRLVSLVDRDRLLWTRENATGRAANRDYVVESKTARWAPAPSERGPVPYAGDKSGTLQKVLAAYERLKTSERAWVDRAISEFGVASCSSTIEVSLLYWHSVLDFLRDRLEYKGNPIGHRIAALCDDCGVSMEGTAPPEIIEALQADKGSKRKNTKLRFPFTDLRNQVTHHGFDVVIGRHMEVLQARGQARALCERILLSYLKVDYTETTLGTVSRW